MRLPCLGYVRDIAEKWLDWNKLGPIVAQYRAMIEKEIEADTRKLESYEDFLAATSPEPAPANAEPGQRRPRSLRDFVEKRRQYLISYTDPKQSK